MQRRISTSSVNSTSFRTVRCHHYQGQEHNRIHKDVQSKINEAVSGNAYDAEYRSESHRTHITNTNEQVLTRLPNYRHDKPNTQHKSDHATTRKQLEIVVVRFLRCHQPRSIVVTGDPDPVTTQTDTNN